MPLTDVACTTPASAIPDLTECRASGIFRLQLLMRAQVPSNWHNIVQVDRLVPSKSDSQLPVWVRTHRWHRRYYILYRCRMVCSVCSLCAEPKSWTYCRHQTPQIFIIIVFFWKIIRWHQNKQHNKEKTLWQDKVSGDSWDSKKVDLATGAKGFPFLVRFDEWHIIFSFSPGWYCGPSNSFFSQKVKHPTSTERPIIY